MANNGKFALAVRADWRFIKNIIQITKLKSKSKKDERYRDVKHLAKLSSDAAKVATT